MTCGLAHANVIVNEITWHSICKLLMACRLHSIGNPKRKV
jgi:hypothetical protein